MKRATAGDGAEPSMHERPGPPDPGAFVYDTATITRETRRSASEGEAADLRHLG